MTFLTLNEVSRILRRLRTEASIEKGPRGGHIVQDPALNLTDDKNDTSDDLPGSEEQGSDL